MVVSNYASSSINLVFEDMVSILISEDMQRKTTWELTVYISSPLVEKRGI